MISIILGEMHPTGRSVPLRPKIKAAFADWARHRYPATATKIISVSCKHQPGQFLPGYVFTLYQHFKFVAHIYQQRVFQESHFLRV